MFLLSPSAHTSGGRGLVLLPGTDILPRRRAGYSWYWHTGFHSGKAQSIPAAGSSVTVKTARLRPVSHSPRPLFSKTSNTRLKSQGWKPRSQRWTLGKTHINSTRSTPQQLRVLISAKANVWLKQLRQSDSTLWMKPIKMSISMLLQSPYMSFRESRDVLLLLKTTTVLNTNVVPVVYHLSDNTL